MSSFVWPANGGYVSSPFGPRKAPKPGASTYHNGIDIAGATTILAAKPGKVIAKSFNKYRGNFVKIDHGGGIVTLYQHARSFSVSVGSTVRAGQAIGQVGSTGVSTGPHLHFEVQVGGACRNPLNYVSRGNTKYTGGAYSGGSTGGTTKKSTGKTTSKTTRANASGTVSAPVVETNKEITTVVSKSVTGSPTAQKVLLTNRPAYLSDGVEILIQHDKVYLPVIAGEVKVEWSRKGAPGKLTFTCLKDGVLNFQEGNPVTLRFNGTPIFAGYVFKKSRQDALQIEVTAYDQIRYLKNEDTISYTGKTYADVLKMVAADYQLTLGEVADTKYKIPARIEEGTILDALQNASDLTVMNTGVLYVLYDDFGKLTLKPLKEMILNVAVDEDVAQDYDYSSSIDKDTYNKIKLAVDNGTTGQRETHVLNHPGNQAKWGQLQYYEKLDGDLKVSDIKARAKVLLDFYNKKRRSLTIRGIFGNRSVRGGSLIVVNMGLGDISVKNYMCVEKVTHTFAPGLHTMDVQLSGIRGEFVV